MISFDVSDFEVVIEKDGVQITLEKSEFKEVATEFFCQELNTDNITVIDDSNDVETVVEFSDIECNECGEFFEDRLTVYLSDFTDSVTINHMCLDRK